MGILLNPTEIGTLTPHLGTPFRVLGLQNVRFWLHPHIRQTDWAQTVHGWC